MTSTAWRSPASVAVLPGCASSSSPPCGMLPRVRRRLRSCACTLGVSFSDSLIRCIITPLYRSLPISPEARGVRLSRSRARWLCGPVARFSLLDGHCPSWAFGALVGPFSSLWARSALLCLTASAKSDARRAFVGRIGRSLIACPIFAVSSRRLRAASAAAGPHQGFGRHWRGFQDCQCIGSCPLFDRTVSAPPA